MSNDNSADGSCKTRSALGDLTNRLLKRGFSKISAESDVRNGDGNEANSGYRDGGLRKLAKKASSGDENSVVEKSGEDCIPKGVADDAVSATCSDGDSTNGINASVITLYDDVEGKSGDNVIEIGDVAMSPGQISEDDSQSTPTIGNIVPRNDERDSGVGEVCRTAYGSTKWSQMPTSLRCSMERCTSLGGAPDLNGDDSLNDCSCSFCLQAAHILSDLQYQDIKGRINALKKSQKEAAVLVRRSFRETEIDPKGPRCPNKTSKLESDLSSQWRSLFLHMEDVFVNEGNHLHDKFVTLKDLRDSCKMELETSQTATGVPSERL